MGATVSEQTHFQFQDDDNTDVNLGTLVGTEDVRFSALLDTTYVFRLKVKVTGMAFNNMNQRLEYNVDGTGWNQISSTSSNVRLADAQPSTGDSVQERLTNDGGGYNNGLYEETGDGPNHDIPVGEMEFAWGITFRSADLTAGSENVDLRITDVGTLLNTYTEIDAAVMPAAAGDVLQAQVWM